MDTKSFDAPTNDVEFNLAIADIKGRRFQDATAKFQALAKATNTTKTWCGLALSKMGLVSHGEAAAPTPTTTPPTK